MCCFCFRGGESNSSNKKLSMKTTTSKEKKKVVLPIPNPIRSKIAREAEASTIFHSMVIMKTDEESAQDETARVLLDFLEVAVTSIVYLKGVHPSGAFERRRYMNLVVHKATHPELRGYIHFSVHGLLPFILQGLVDRVAVIFFNNANSLLERFVFKLQMNQSYGSKVEETDLEFSLRSFLIKVSVSNTLTRPLSQDCRWEVNTYFSSLPETSTSKDAELWISTDAKQWKQPPLITPVKSMSSEPLDVQLYLEHPSLSESKA